MIAWLTSYWEHEALKFLQATPTLCLAPLLPTNRIQPKMDFLLSRKTLMYLWYFQGLQNLFATEKDNEPVVYPN
jgi:hypothetical protein